jgi:acyl dehydratase/NAD(P)-dependent dehydrogenase (short-subunit alcohol dehydrogenase family)
MTPESAVERPSLAAPGEIRHPADTAVQSDVFVCDRVFTMHDQRAFADLSGDVNPLHVDPIAARRLLFGRAVVHGVHLLLWALDEHAARSGPWRYELIKAQFARPVGVDERVECHWTAGPGQAEAELRSGGVVCTKIRVKLTAISHQGSGPRVERGRPEQHSPRILADSEIAARSGDLALCLDADLAERLFPRLTSGMSALQLAVILATTRLVGVECPGLNSVFFELTLSAADTSGGAALHYEVTRHSVALALAAMALSAPGFSGTIKAFVRPVQQNAASFASLAARITPGEFAEQRALVVGGSRGLGAVTAKLLAAGGASTRITYQRGHRDAEDVVQEIAKYQSDIAALPLDVLEIDGDVALQAIQDWAPTDLYYFATPFIFSSANGVFEVERFQNFCTFYVTAFEKLVRKLAPAGLRSVLYPSSTAVEELPLNLGEYAAAKAAGESVCKYLEKRHRGLRIHAVRFPRLATDQTASVSPVENGDPVPALADALRAMRT